MHARGRTMGGISLSSVAAEIALCAKRAEAFR